MPVDYDKLAQQFGGVAEDDDLDRLAKSMGGVSVPQVSAPPTQEELRAGRVRTASPKELRRIHFGENIPAGARAAQQAGQTIPEFATGLLAEAPARAISAIPQLPRLAYEAVTKPAQVGMELVKGIGTDVEKLATGTPREAGVASFNLASLAAPAAKGITVGGGAVTAPIRTGWKTYQGAQVGNRIKAGLGISDTDVRALAAVDESLSTLRGGTKAKVPFTNTESMAGFVSSSNKKFFKQHHENLAQINQSLPVEFMGEQTSLDKVLAERTRLNKRLNHYQSQDSQTRAIMEEVNPSLKADVERLQAARDTINSAIDTVAPQSASQADIMRTFSHLKELEDITTARAAQLKAIKEIAKGSKLPFSEVAKDFIMNKLTLGAMPGAQIPAKTLAALRRGLAGPRVDPDKLIRIAGKKFKHVKPAEAITPKPMALAPAARAGTAVTGEEAATARSTRESQLAGSGMTPDEVAEAMRTQAILSEGQLGLPFVPPEVGGIQVPSRLTAPPTPPPISGSAPAIEPVPQPQLGGSTVGEIPNFEPYKGPERRAAGREGDINMRVANREELNQMTRGIDEAIANPEIKAEVDSIQKLLDEPSMSLAIGTPNKLQNRLMELTQQHPWIPGYIQGLRFTRHKSEFPLSKTRPGERGSTTLGPRTAETPETGKPSPGKPTIAPVPEKTQLEKWEEMDERIEMRRKEALASEQAAGSGLRGKEADEASWKKAGIRVRGYKDAHSEYVYTPIEKVPEEWGRSNYLSKIEPQLQKLKERGISGMTLKDLKALPIEDTAKVAELKKSFAERGDRPEGFAAKRGGGLPALDIRSGGKITLANGRHRLEAARQAGLDELKFQVSKFDPEGDMLWDAVVPVRIRAGKLRRQKIWYTREK